MALILSGDTGPSFVQDAAMPSGSVIQVVSNTTNSDVSTTSSSYVTTGLSATITPTSATSKIYISINGGTIDHIGNYAVDKFMIYRNGSAVSADNNLQAGYNSYTNRVSWGVSVAYLDSPASTSAQTYTLYFKTDNGNNAQIEFCGFSAACTITLMEIAA